MRGFAMVHLKLGANHNKKTISSCEVPGPFGGAERSPTFPGFLGAQSKDDFQGIAPKLRYTRFAMSRGTA